MFILLNNKIPVNVLDIIRVTSVYEIEPSKVFPSVKGGWRFMIIMRDRTEIRSKIYETKDVAEDCMKKLLVLINTITAELPIIDI